MKSILFLLFIVPAYAGFSQSILLNWIHLQGGNHFDMGAYDAQQTTDGGYIYNSTINSANSGDVNGVHGGQESWVVKTDLFGNIEWQRPCGGPSIETGYGIVQTADGGYLAIGSSGSDTNDVTFNWGGYDAWVIKLDSSGNREWDKSVGGVLEDIAHGVALNADGSMVLAGGTRSSNGDIVNNNGLQDVLVYKLSSTGNLMWLKTYGGSITEEARDIYATSDGGYILAGSTYSSDGDVTSNAGFYDYWVLKLDSLGDLEWQKTYGGSGDDDAFSIKQTSDGGYIVVGSSDSNDGDVSNNHGATDIWIVKLDAQGAVEWEKSLGGTDYDLGESIIEISTGNYFVTGHTYSNDGDVSGNHGDLDAWVAVIGPTGDLLDQRCIGGSGADFGLSIKEDSNGEFIFAGGSESNDGDVSGLYGTRDIMIAKLRVLTTIGIEEEELAVSVSPNPSESMITIASATNLTGASYTITDNTGKTVLVGTFINNFEISTEQLTSGMYYLSIEGTEKTVKFAVK